MTVKELVAHQVVPSIEVIDDLKQLYDFRDPRWSLIQGYTLGVIMGKRMERARRKRAKNNQ